MLTTTYSLIVFAAEQKGTRARITLLRDYIHHAVAGASEMDSALVDAVLTQLNGFHHYLQERRLDVYLIEKMRKPGLHATQLLAELESLSQLILTVLRWTREKLALATRYGGLYLIDLQEAIELYCTSVLKKVDKEDDELLPMATQLLTAEDWFQIAGQLLSPHSKISVTKTDSGVSTPIISIKTRALSGQTSANVRAISDSCGLAHAAIDPIRLQRAGLRTPDALQENIAG